MIPVPTALVALVLAAAHLFGAPAGGPERVARADVATASVKAEAGARRAQRTRVRRCAVKHGRAGRVRARCARITVRSDARRRRARRRETLTDALATPPPGPGSPGPGPVTPPPGDPPPAPQRNVSVTAREFSLQLSRPAVDHGRVGVQLRNAGEDPHNLQVALEGSLLEVLLSFPTLGSLESDRRYEDLTPGRYVLWCSLEGHEALGMSTTLDVR